MKYTKTFRDSILRKVLPSENRSVSSVSKEMAVTGGCQIKRLDTSLLNIPLSFT